MCIVVVAFFIALKGDEWRDAPKVSGLSVFDALSAFFSASRTVGNFVLRFDTF